MTAKLAALPIGDGERHGFGPNWIVRSNAQFDANNEPRFVITTPPILLVNKQISGEAIKELRRQPLIVDYNMMQVFETFKLSIGYFIPLRSFYMIEHIHFMRPQPKEEVQMLLWDGCKLTGDLVVNKEERKGFYPGIMRKHWEEGTDCPLRKVSFERLADQPMLLDFDKEGTEDDSSPVCKQQRGASRRSDRY